MSHSIQTGVSLTTIRNPKFEFRNPNSAILTIRNPKSEIRNSFCLASAVRDQYIYRMWVNPHLYEAVFPSLIEAPIGEIHVVAET